MLDVQATLQPALLYDLQVKRTC